METVWLQWHGPFVFSELNGYNDASLNSDAGVYTFLDSEELEHGWGNFKLYYVGMVYGRMFRARIPEHAVGGGDDAWRCNYQVANDEWSIYPVVTFTLPFVGHCSSLLQTFQLLLFSSED